MSDQNYAELYEDMVDSSQRMRDAAGRAESIMFGAATAPDVTVPGYPPQPTWNKRFEGVVDAALIITAGDFTSGVYITARNQSVLWPEASGGDGKEYRWTGSLPKTVAPDSTPLSTGGVYPSGLWVDVGTSALSVRLLNGTAAVGDVTSGILSDAYTKPRGIQKCAYWANELRKGVSVPTAFFGDSTFWGATVGDLATQNPNNPPASFAQAINLLYGVSISATNFGISGSTLRGMISGTDGSGSTFEAKISGGNVQASAAAIIYCNHGINDSQLDLPIDQYRQDLLTFVDLCWKYGKTPVVVTATPNPILLIIDEAKAKRLRAYVDVARQVAAQMDVDLVDQFYYFSKTATQVKINEMFPDGPHLSSAAYRQAGYNLAIPLVSAGTLSDPGDLVGLNQVSWFDNADVSRQLQQRPTASGTRCGVTLSFARNPSSITGLNYPVVLDKPQRCVSMIGLQWNDGAKMDVSVNGFSIFYPFSLEKQYGNILALDWDSELKIKRQMWAGLNIFQFLFDIATPSTYTGFAFSGLYLPEKDVSGMTRGSADTSEVISFYDNITASFNFDATSVFTLSDTSGSPVLSVSKDSGIFTAKLYVNGAVTVTQALSGVPQADGTYPISITVLPSRIDFAIVNIGYSLDLLTPLPSLRLTTPWVAYSVRSTL